MNAPWLTFITCISLPQDAASIDEGEEVTLLRWTSVLVTGATRRPSDGMVTSLQSEYLPVFKFLKKKKDVTWLANCADLVNVKLLTFGPLLTRSNIPEHECASAYFNHQSIKTDDAFGDPALRLLKVGEVIQLERHGFYRVDRPYVSPLQPMVLFMVPDGKTRRALPDERCRRNLTA